MPKAVLGQYRLFTDRNTKDDLAWTTGNGDPMYGMCIQRVAHGNSKGEARGRIRHKSNSKKLVRDLEKRNMGTKEKSPQKGLIRAKDLIIELSEGRESPYHRLDYLINLT